MSILVNKSTKVITQGMTEAATAAGARVDGATPIPYITHNLCNCGIWP